jgi:uncharacterized membrane protein
VARTPTRHREFFVKPLAIGLTALHGIVLMLGLFGLLVAIPHPEVWSHSQSDADFFAFAINKTGGAGMVLGALAMFAYGVWKLGWKRTAIFFLLAVGISASAELTGTATGWPFGGYEYQELLGYKLLGRVPYSIPLSWFYMGFAAFLIADGIVAARGIKHRTLVAVLFGSYLLTAWDLVLDPSMAAPQLAYMHFWVWHETGPYYGMPLRNFGGWLGLHRGGSPRVGFLRDGATHDARARARGAVRDLCDQHRVVDDPCGIRRHVAHRRARARARPRARGVRLRAARRVVSGRPSPRARFVSGVSSGTRLPANSGRKQSPRGRICARSIRASRVSHTSPPGGPRSSSRATCTISSTARSW